MAGASDPLEDMLFNEVDEKAVSDLVGSLESQLGDRKTPTASYSDGKQDIATVAAGQFSGKVRDQVGSTEQPQQGHLRAGSTLESGANEPLSGKPIPTSTSAVATGAVITPGASLQTTGAPTQTASSGSGPVTLATQSGASASFHRAAVLGPSTAPSATVVPAAEPIGTSSPGLHSLNGSTGAVKLVNSPGVPPPAGAGSAIIASTASQPSFPVPQSPVGSTAVALQRQPSPVTGVAQNGVDPKGAPSPSVSTSQVMNHSNPLMHTKMLVPTQPVSGNSVILTTTPPPAAAPSPIAQTQAGTSTSPTATKPIVNGVTQPAVAVVRQPGPSVSGATSIQHQRPGMVTGMTRAATPQPALAVRPQQQTTIQLPPGFTIPPGESMDSGGYLSGQICKSVSQVSD